MTDPLDAAWAGLPELVDRPTLTRVIGESGDSSVTATPERDGAA